MGRLVCPSPHRPRGEEADPYHGHDEQKTQPLLHGLVSGKLSSRVFRCSRCGSLEKPWTQPLLRGRVSGNCGHRFFRCSRRDSLEKPQADADEPDEQAENDHAPEASRDPLGDVGIGTSRCRRADAQRGAVNVVCILDDRVADEGANVRARAVIEGVRPGTPFQ